MFCLFFAEEDTVSFLTSFRIRILGMIVLLAVSRAVLPAVPRADAVQVLYTMESPDSGNSVFDRLFDDGMTDSVLENGVRIDPASLNPAFGSQGLSFTNAAGTNRLGFDLVGDEIDLGSSFTLSACIDPDALGWIRTFSSFSGGGATTLDGECYFGIDTRDPAGSPYYANGLRIGFITREEGQNPVYHNVEATSPVDWATDGYHQIGATFDSGAVSLYFDGTLVGSGTVPMTSVSVPNGFYFGEDRLTADNETFSGHADDILIYDRALTSTEMQSMATSGAVSTLGISGGLPPEFSSVNVVYTAENDTTVIRDKFDADGAQDAAIVGSVSVTTDPADVKMGDSAIAIGDAARTAGVVEVSSPRILGEKFTLAAWARYDLDAAEVSQVRLMSSYSGSGPAGTGEILFDFNPAGGSEEYIRGVRFLIGRDDGWESVIPDTTVTFDDGEYHHFAAVYDEGSVTVYLDGTEISSGTITHDGPVILDRALCLGGDHNEWSGSLEQFSGFMDDVVVLPEWALSAAEISSLMTNGAESLLGTPELEGDLNGDGTVSSGDLDIVRGHWGQTVPAGDLLSGDPSGDGLVGSADLDIVRGNWGLSLPAAVPEPGVCTVLMFGGIALAMFRRRSR